MLASSPDRPSRYFTPNSVGHRVGEGWIAPRLSYRDAYPEYGAKPAEARSRPDFPSFGTPFVISARARRVLGRWLEQGVELLPTLCDEDELWILNVTRVLDVLDVERSEGRRLPSGRYSELTKPVLRSPLPDCGFFRIPGQVSQLFATEGLVDLIQRESLTGLHFDPVEQSGG